MSGFEMDFYIGRELDKYLQSLDTLYQKTDEMVDAAIRPGAGRVADAVRSAISDIPRLEREPRNSEPKKKSGDRTIVKNTPKGKLPAGATRLEREGLLKGMGLAPIRKDGNFVNTKLGMDGYNEHKTSNYPKGHPNAMVARSLESGTSYRQKTPFIRPAVNKVMAKAEKLMQESYEKELRQIMNI